MRSRADWRRLGIALLLAVAAGTVAHAGDPPTVKPVAVKVKVRKQSGPGELPPPATQHVEKSSTPPRF